MAVTAITGSKLYWAACIPKVTYGSKVMDLKGETMDIMEVYHAEIAKNIQGFANHV